MNLLPFRFIDLIVCIAVGIALLTGVVGARRAAQADSTIIGCASNLSRLAQTLVMYESINNGQFPRTRYDPAAPLATYTGADSPDPFTGPAANDVTAAQFLLARTMDLPPDAFTCPSAIRLNLAEEERYDRSTVKQRSNFRARLNDNYSWANMYPDAAAVAAGYSLDHFYGRLPDAFAIASDTNPGGKSEAVATTQADRMTMRMANSPNHERDGQNVLFANGSVAFFNSPFVGQNYDNIYTGHAAERQPADAADTVLLPIWGDGPQLTSQAIVGRRWVLGTAAVLIFGIMGWIVRRGIKRTAADQTFGL